MFPAWVQGLADVLPLHHGLLGLRALLDGGPSLAVLEQVGLEIGIGVAWFLASLVAFRTFAESGRRDGTIDLVE